MKSDLLRLLGVLSAALVLAFGACARADERNDALDTLLALPARTDLDAGTRDSVVLLRLRTVLAHLGRYDVDRTARLPELAGLLDLVESPEALLSVATVIALLDLPDPALRRRAADRIVRQQVLRGTVPLETLPSVGEALRERLDNPEEVTGILARHAEDARARIVAGYDTDQHADARGAPPYDRNREFFSERLRTLLMPYLTTRQTQLADLERGRVAARAAGLLRCVWPTLTQALAGRIAFPPAVANVPQSAERTAAIVAFRREAVEALFLIAPQDVGTQERIEAVREAEWSVAVSGDPLRQRALLWLEIMQRHPDRYRTRQRRYARELTERARALHEGESYANPPDERSLFVVFCARFLEGLRKSDRLDADVLPILRAGLDRALVQQVLLVEAPTIARDLGLGLPRELAAQPDEWARRYRGGNVADRQALLSLLYESSRWPMGAPLEEPVRRAHAALLWRELPALVAGTNGIRGVPLEIALNATRTLRWLDVPPEPSQDVVLARLATDAPALPLAAAARELLERTVSVRALSTEALAVLAEFIRKAAPANSAGDVLYAVETVLLRRPSGDLAVVRPLVAYLDTRKSPDIERALRLLAALPLDAAGYALVRRVLARNEAVAEWAGFSMPTLVQRAAEAAPNNETLDCGDEVGFWGGGWRRWLTPAGWRRRP